MNNDKNFKLIFLFLLSAHTALILSVDFFPFADVPSHLAEGTIYRHYNEAGNLFNKYYSLHYLFYPNTFHLFFFSLPIFPTVEVANRILHLFTVVSLPVLVLLIIKELKGSKWFVIMSFILIYGFNLSFGFTGNAVANDVILLIIWLWLKSITHNKHSYLYMVSISALLLFVYFLHAMVALYCLLMVFAFMVYRHRNNIKTLTLNLFTLVPLATLILYWWFFIQNATESAANFDGKELSTGEFMKIYYSYEFFHTYPRRAMFLLADNFQLFSGPAGYVTGVALSFVIIIPALVVAVKYLNKKGNRNAYSFFQNIDTKFYYAILFFLVSAACYFLLPKRIPGQEPLYERFSTILLLAILFIGSKIQEANNRFFTYTATIIAFLHLALWGQYFYQFDKENIDFSKILPQDHNKVLSFMNYAPDYRGRNMYDHFQNYFIVRNKGIATSRVIDYRFGMIRRQLGTELPFQNHMYRYDSPRELIKQADYLLIKGNIYPDHKALLDSFNTFKTVKNLNDWHLLKRVKDS